ncbi:MAG: hydroxymethylbilane synthase [Wenzhouxiangellaceae bacterium]|nr:hydroxymethylbilane synthase [Wenzhouxiangellaceae bacterium]MBS3745608.1 hydroxymethylbilane synthase [Wenzhouxiangellaceae bacterium]MBS3823398.1 hydroxymethylbilane synthase [Wenzhouxiangellaceae bacterium]
MKTITIATRKSRLALWQTEHVAASLSRLNPDIEVRTLPLSTRGDEILDRSLAEIGGKGLFLKELEKALLDGRADVAVHSLKDVPAEKPDRLELGAFLPRANSADLWISDQGVPIAQLPRGSRVGSSSLRRISQLRAIRPDLEVVALRGNVETRLAAVREHRVDATVLAAAGLERLDVVPPSALALDVAEWLPAPGQGIITVQQRAGDEETARLIASLACARTTAQARAEREVVRVLGGDCRMPLAAHAWVDGDRLRLRARLGDESGRLIDAVSEGMCDHAVEIGAEAARGLLDSGGAELLDRLDMSQS